MTTRTFAANATAVPAKNLDRRTMLASAAAAAVLAAIVTPAAAEALIDPDAALLALRQPYEQTLALMDHHSPPTIESRKLTSRLRLRSPQRPSGSCASGAV